MPYQHLFFDLDHTLWDFERSSGECLTEIYQTFDMAGMGINSIDDFVSTYLRINYQLWRELERGEIPHGHIREHRFRRVLEEFGVHAGIDFRPMEEAYMEMLPTKSYLIDGSLEVLNYVRDQGYILHVLTNGYDLVQGKKMRSAGIFDYFVHIVTNEKAQARKPDRRIFEYALQCAGAGCDNGLMIGDNWEADILGAKGAGMDTVYYNPAGNVFDESPTHDIRHLRELMEIL
ncbi:YjjG family noncanonical pyrimidine nucleotidase [Persicitalea jodogahamensis]|uniref:Noncanonical pyrimidine nucleotidase, YjjG family protein n=1 Tax=Persicitalea jodogahamensis TaxID=402147 RepID=A0A8J3D1X8_9BACT|nr:YjjG family noncanonical pyrimidine nucleotidase [Persicitalea jodogahamensis]GHB55517.1 noncanonical pyrimidine nucleotidase, YjjG family protein [Persicitalea jodogahamensis]